MIPFSKIRRYFWLRRLGRLALPMKLDLEPFRKLSDERLFATLNVAERVKRFEDPQMLQLAIALAAQHADAAGSFFCATDADVKSTLATIQLQIEQERASRAAAAARRSEYRSSAPYERSVASGARLSGG
jgi:hypothetical protein